MSQQSARYQRSAGGMVGAMLVLVALLLGWVLVRSFLTDKPQTAVRSVDYTREVPAAKESADIDLLAPPQLPRGWRATSVRFSPAPEARWHLGVLTSENRYVGLEQSKASPASMLTEHVDEDTTRGDPVDVAGQPWATYTDAGGDLALVRRAQGTTTLVVGHLVSRSDLVSYTASLR